MSAKLQPSVVWKIIFYNKFPYLWYLRVWTHFFFFLIFELLSIRQCDVCLISMHWLWHCTVHTLTHDDWLHHRIFAGSQQQHHVAIRDRMIYTHIFIYLFIFEINNICRCAFSLSHWARSLKPATLPLFCEIVFHFDCTGCHYKFSNSFFFVRFFWSLFHSLLAGCCCRRFAYIRCSNTNNFKFYFLFGRCMRDNEVLVFSALPIDRRKTNAEMRMNVKWFRMRIAFECIRWNG